MEPINAQLVLKCMRPCMLLSLLLTNWSRKRESFLLGQKKKRVNKKPLFSVATSHNTESETHLSSLQRTVKPHKRIKDQKREEEKRFSTCQLGLDIRQMNPG